MQVCLQKKYAPIVDFPWTILGKGQYNEYSKAREMDMITRPILTIAIPTYNGSKTIRNMLDILLPQVTEDVELIVSDNCSTDSTPQIIADYKKKYSIRYIRNESNIGPDANYLQCMRLARGKFTYLLSDDDIVVENGLSKILRFLYDNPDVKLVYLDSVGFKSVYKGVKNCHRYTEHVRIPEKNICSADRIEFMNYAIRMWGFLSSFLWSTERFNQIKNPEQYFGTYWLQSYIHISCVPNEDDKLGVIAGPVVAAGEYAGVNNFSTAIVDGIYYKKMLQYAVQCGHFDYKQLKRFYIWRVCFLGRIAVIKERESQIKKTNIADLFKCTCTYPQAWITLYPFFFTPRWVIKLRKKILRTADNSLVKRET